MEIVKFKKIKGNIYELLFDNELSIKLYDDIIIKYNLLANKIINHDLFEVIVKENDSLNAYYDSLKRIKAKLRSEKELRTYLENKGYDQDIIDNNILKLKKDGYLNHDLYIKSYINDEYNFTNNGPRKILNNLKQLGFNNDEIIPYLDLDFKNKAENIINKKLKNNKKSNYIFKKWISEYLNNLGYTSDLYLDYLNAIRIDDGNNLRKDIELLIRKYHNKYENNDLKKIIKDKLYKKGYNIDEVGVIINELL